MLDGVCVFYGEVQADATMFARRKQVANAKARSEDWLIVATGGCGRRGQDVGVGDSLGDLDFTNEEAVKIIKSARSARDMAILNRDTPIVWLVHSHKHALLFVVWTQSSESVIAECVGHCRNPLAAKNVVLAVADCADLFMKARQIIRNALSQIHTQTRAPRGPFIDEKKKPKELPILATPPSVHPAPRSPAVGLIRVAPNADASKRRQSLSNPPQSHPFEQKSLFALHSCWFLAFFLPTPSNTGSASAPRVYLHNADDVNTVAVAGPNRRRTSERRRSCKLR
ncbi:hypothetical protein HDU88_000764 [Geranomyces variabilis]|nr:hypothetical protein HDU88_000764 [Geranomyces variabilis]